MSVHIQASEPIIIKYKIDNGRHFSGLLMFKFVLFRFKTNINPKTVIKTKMYTGIISDKIQNKIGDNILK